MKLLSITLTALLLFGNSSIVFAVTQQNTIAEKEAKIKELEQQIKQYESQVQYHSTQAKSLNTEVANLNSSQKALQTSLSSTNIKIDKTNLTMNQNVDEIRDLSQGISNNRQVTAETLRKINIQDGRSMVEIFLRNESISDFLRDYQDLAQLQNTLRGSVQIMRDKTIQLANAQGELEKQRQELQELSGELSDKGKILSDQKREKDKLLKETKGKQSEYEKIVKTLQQQVEQINNEIREYESQLKFSLNPQSLPPSGASVLGWPIKDVTVTQLFGRTVDAKRLYITGSHSGVDFRAAVGTPIYSVGDGIIEGVGDTDLTCPKASFGKWIFIRHNNGLSTAYGHLSKINVTTGQQVKKGELIGYSGNTGHTTGPHLHLTVYASNGVDGEEGARIAQRPSTACSGKNYTMPLAPINAYLDPMLYLPTTGFSLK